MAMKKLDVIVIGAGSRGIAYTDIMKTHSDKFRVVGVAEPIADRRDYIQKKHDIDDAHCFENGEEMLALPRFADVAVISTMDRDHCQTALKAMEKGYHLLLEKPVAPTPEECIQILNQAKKYDRKIMVCHVLRYAPFYMRLKQVLKSGIIGDIVSVVHNEDVGAIHQSHSFVRGNWGNTERSACMLLGKSCHDLDLIQWLLEKDCKKIQSFGSLRYFKKDYAPEGSPEYCIEGCPKGEECMYNATRFYLNDELDLGTANWFKTAATHKKNPTREDVEAALRSSQFGKCVFKCDNDVVDHQVVNMEFEDDTTVTFTMCAFSVFGRTTKIMGTEGCILANMGENSIEIYQHATGKKVVKDLSGDAVDETIVGGHGGGDGGIVDALYDYLTGRKTADEVSEIGISCKNHMLVFAAEKSRLEGTVVDMDEYMTAMGYKIC